MNEPTPADRDSSADFETSADSSAARDPSGDRDASTGPGASADREPSGDPGPPADPGPPSDTRRALLAAGRDLFTRRGFDGASIRAITTRADANLGAVTYHFGSKKALYRAVVEEVLQPLAHRVRDATDDVESGLDRAEAVLRAFFRHLEENPDMPQLIVQEIAAGKAPPRPVREVMRTVLTCLVTAVQDGQAAGEIRPGDPLLLSMSVISQPIHLTLASRFARAVVGVDLLAPEARSGVVEHAARFVRAGLAAEGHRPAEGADARDGGPPEGAEDPERSP